jgi:hypothetical protein
MMQVARNLLDAEDGFLRNATHLIHDRDPVFAKAWRDLLKSEGVRCVRIPASSPASASNDNAMGNDIRCRSRLGGLLNFYHREAA